MIRVALVLFSLACPLLSVAGDLPDPSLTPGSIDTRVTQANIASTICARGYTRTVRPSRYYTDSLKRRQIAQYRYVDRNPELYEEDHLVPLNLGGHPTDEHNLWPEPRTGQWGADRKDELEYTLYRLVCSRTVSLAQAQAEIAHDWIHAYQEFVGGGNPARHGYAR